MLKLDKISKVYQTKSELVEAVNNFSYEFEKGKFYAIMGHSGSGKSTLISILGLIDNVSDGKYFIEDRDVSLLSDNELSSIRRDKIGFIFQDYYLDIHLKAYENVILPMLINKDIDRKDRETIALELLKKVGLEPRINHFPKEMSGGEQQRVCLARALANNPEIILADEPTGNLDEENEKIIFEELKKLSKDKCIIVVSHSSEVKKYADVVLNMKNGKLVK